MKIMNKFKLFALLISIAPALSYCAAAKPAAKYAAKIIVVKPRIADAESINDLIAVATKNLLDPYIKNITEANTELIGVFQSQAQTELALNPNKDEFVKRYVDLMNSTEHPFENIDLKKVEAEANDEWETVKQNVLNEVDRVAKDKADESGCGCCG